MLKTLSLTIALFTGMLIYAQDLNYNFQYEFALTGITESGPAKMEIEAIRDLMGVRVVKFNDFSNIFIVLTHLEFDPAELLMKLESNGLDIDGEIVKIDIG